MSGDVEPSAPPDCRHVSPARPLPPRRRPACGGCNTNIQLSSCRLTAGTSHLLSHASYILPACGECCKVVPSPLRCLLQAPALGLGDDSQDGSQPVVDAGGGVLVTL